MIPSAPSVMISSVFLIFFVTFPQSEAWNSNDLITNSMFSPPSNALSPHFGDPDPLEELAGVSERGLRSCPCRRSEICVKFGSMQG